MSKQGSTNITWHHGEVTTEGREEAYGHRGAVVWLTGLSGSGKSTIAYRLESILLQAGCKAYVLDGDNLRHGLNGDLGFAPEDRAENIRRVGEVAKLFLDAGIIVIAAFVSPYAADRAAIRESVSDGAFFEVFVDTPLDVCESRDPKGLYAKARAGEIKNFTGIDDPFEEPVEPEIKLDTHLLSVDESVGNVISFLRSRGIVPAHPEPAFSREISKQ